jgi:hypothetical protein
MANPCDTLCSDAEKFVVYLTMLPVAQTIQPGSLG